ncbi:MAG: DUF1611 domain-containing protein [Pseudomonadota bacterium]
MNGLQHYPQPSLSACVDAYERAARLTNERAQVVGVSLNTGGMDAAAAQDLIHRTEDALTLPCVDPVRTGVDRLISTLID